MNFGKLVRVLSSLKLTVWLLALLMVLVFAGTWAQIDMGIWTTLRTYFRSFFVWIPFAVFFPRNWEVPGGLPFPGGYLLGAVLMVNLAMAHAARFQVSRRKSGILLIHVGLVLLVVGELVTGMFAEESRMSIDEGQTVQFAEDTREVELAIVDISDPEHDRVVTIPQARLRNEAFIQDRELPFDVEIVEYLPNAELFESEEPLPPVPHPGIATANRGFAAELNARARQRQAVSGVDQDEIDLPVAFVNVSTNGVSHGTWMAALYFNLAPRFGMQPVVVDGKTYLIGLRYKRIYKPYSIHLVDFSHDRYLGTDTPRNFSSLVRLVDTAQNEDREVLIYMNNPLRYRGETFYQASFKQGDRGTVLQIVRNPGWLLPYVACTLGALGMLIHFGMHLTRFLNRRRAA
jgi:hypothetical protein